MNRNYFPILTEMERRLPYYITSAGGWDHQEPIVRTEGYPDFQWIQCLNGEGVLQVGDSDITQPVGKGQGMLLYPHEAHQYRAVRGPWEVMWLGFNGSLVRETLTALDFTDTQVLYISQPGLTQLRLTEASNLLESADPMQSMEGSHVVYHLLLSLYKYGSAAEIRSKHQHFDQLAPILEYMELHFDQTITLKMLADQIGVSPQHTCLLFKQALGMRPIAYLTKIRMRKAKELLLRDAHLEVQEVVRRVGFEHPSYFIKMFRQLEGITPQAFRLIHRQAD